MYVQFKNHALIIKNDYVIEIKNSEIQFIQYSLTDSLMPKKPIVLPPKLQSIACLTAENLYVMDT